MSTPNYKLHPFDISEKFQKSHGEDTRYALLRIVFTPEIPPEIIQKYKSQILQFRVVWS